MLDIIMPTHNHLEHTIRSIDCLKAYTSDFRLTIVDDSTDITPIHISDLMREGCIKIKYIRFARTEGNPNVNEGMRQTTSNPVVFMAQNTFVEPGWADYPLQIMANDPKIALVGIKLLFPNGIIEHAGIALPEGAPYWCDIGRGEPGHRYSFIGEVPAVGFALVFIRREAFSNGFPEKLYPYGFAGPDDVDACFEARKRGWKVVYCGLSSAYHIANATRDKGADYAEKVEKCRQFFLSRWGTNGTMR